MPSRQALDDDQRERAADRHVPRRPTHVAGRHQAARLSTTPISTSRGCSIRGWSRSCAPRRRASASSPNLAGAAARRADRVRADVHGDRADRAAVGGLARAELRQPPGRADPAPDRRRAGRLDRQSLRPGADPALRRRPRPARRDLQQDDPGAAHAARRHRARARPDRQPPPLHRGGAGRRQRRRDRRRCRGPHQHPQPLRRAADRARRGGGARQAARRDRAGARRAVHHRAVRHASGWCRGRSRSAAATASAICRCA